MAVLTPQNITRSGLTPSLAAASAGGDEFTPNAGQTFLYVDNGGGSSVTVTVTSFAEAGTGLAQSDLTATVGAGAIALIGPFTPTAYADPSNGGRVQVSYSATASVTVGAIRLNPNS